MPILCTLLLALAIGQDGPHAALTGPAVARVGETVLLSTAGTAGGAIEVKLADGPSPLPVVPLYTAEGSLIYGLAAPSQPGRYTFVTIAGPAAGQPARFDFAFWVVQVDDPKPTPPPPPAPDDVTPPLPVPNPDEVARPGAVVRLLAVYDPVSKAGVGMFNTAAFRQAASETVPIGDDSRPAWRVWAADVDARNEPSWADLLAKARADKAPLPKLVVVDAKGRARVIALPAGTTPESLATTIRALKGSR